MLRIDERVHSDQNYVVPNGYKIQNFLQIYDI